MRALRAAVAFLAVLAATAQAASGTQEILAQANTNNRQDLVSAHIRPARSGCSEISIRSGSLPMMLLAIEIEHADGTTQRQIYQQSLPPGHASAPMRIDPRRGISRILVTKKPGLRDGETVLQVLGRCERR